MSTTPSATRVRPEPRITVTKLGEYLVAFTHTEEVAALLGMTDLRGRLEDHVRRILAEKITPVAAPSTFDAAAARKRIAAITAKIALPIEMLPPQSAQFPDAEIKRLGAEKQLLEAKLREESTPAARAAPGDIDADVKAVMARLKSLSRPVDEIEPAAVRELLETFVEPGSLRVGFTSAAMVLHRKGTGSGRKRSYILDRVKVALLDPRSSMLVTTRWACSP